MVSKENSSSRPWSQARGEGIGRSGGRAMTPEETLLAALAKDPGDELAWLALADELEEDGQQQRGELVRLTRRLCRNPPDDQDPLRTTDERRLIALLTSGVRPCVPEMTNSVGMRLVLVPGG